MSTNAERRLLKDLKKMNDDQTQEGIQATPAGDSLFMWDAVIFGPDDTICVQRKKYVDKTEKDQLKECFVQNVTQCYYTYITEYTDGITEKCKDFYCKIGICPIVFIKMHEPSFSLCCNMLKSKKS